MMMAGTVFGKSKARVPENETCETPPQAPEVEESEKDAITLPPITED
jgi:hypothetical protein